MTRFGIALPAGATGGSPFGASSLGDAARAIEAAGFESAWTFDSLGRGTLRPDPLMALAVAATLTRTVELGTGVLQVPLRNPVELAQRALTLHLVSGGRFRFGVGAGSTAADFAALGFDFDSRFRRLSESLAIMRSLWAGETVGGASLAPVWPRCEGGRPCSSDPGQARDGSSGPPASSTAGSAPVLAAAGTLSRRASRASTPSAASAPSSPTCASISAAPRARTAPTIRAISNVRGTSPARGC